MSNSLRPYGLQHIRLPYPSLSPRVCSNSCPLSQWCHPTISSSVALFSSCPQSFPISQSFPMSWLFASSGQSIGTSASVLPVNIQGLISFYYVLDTMLRASGVLSPLTPSSLSDTILQVRHREAQSLAQGHTANTWWSWDLNWGHPDPRPPCSLDLTMKVLA